jgi:hypothetical protein
MGYAPLMTPRRDSEVFGKVPQGATHYSVRRKGALTWEWCTYAGPEGVATHEFVIGDLSLATIRKRWGNGTYRLMYLALGRGTRQVFGNGKIFELTGPERSATPRTAGAARRGAVPIGRVGLVAAHSPAPEDHSDLVRALLIAGEGKRDGQELFESLAIPVGMALGSAFSSIEKVQARLLAVEERLASIEAKLGGRVGGDAPAEDRLDRMLQKLESIESRLERPASRRRTPPR